jgi:hypothetical protein
MYPTGEVPIDELVRRHVDPHYIYQVLQNSELPNEDSDFFEAWQLVDSAISVNLSKAKDIHRERLRMERKPLLEVLDVQFMRAVESGDVTKQQEVAAQKQKLRDLTKLVVIDDAATTQELRGLTLDALLSM